MRRWRSRLERSPNKQKVRCSNPCRDRPMSLKQAMTAPLPNVTQYVRVSRVLGDDHYKRMPRDIVGVSRSRTLTAQWPKVPSIGYHLQPFTGNGDVSKWENFRVGRKTPNKQTDWCKVVVIFFHPHFQHFKNANVIKILNLKNNIWLSPQMCNQNSPSIFKIDEKGEKSMSGKAEDICIFL